MLPGKIAANTKVIGTMIIPVAMALELATVNAASTPIVKLFPGNFTFKNFLTELAKGSNPSIKICIILGVRTIVAEVLIPTINTLSTGSFANNPITKPMTNPINIGSPTKPNRS